MGRERQHGGVQRVRCEHPNTGLQLFLEVSPWFLKTTVRILPRHHRSSFGSVPRDELGSLAGVLREVLHRLDVALGNPDFNLVLATAAIGDEHKRYFLWHIDVLPRLATAAGFELGSGMAINSVLPEDAARALRSVVSEHK